MCCHIVLFSTFLHILFTISSIASLSKDTKITNKKGIIADKGSKGEIILIDWIIEQNKKNMLK